MCNFKARQYCSYLGKVISSESISLMHLELCLLLLKLSTDQSESELNLYVYAQIIDECMINEKTYLMLVLVQMMYSISSE